MQSQVSPFAALTGAEKQLKWLEYQSIRLPYTEAAVEKPETPVAPAPEAASETPKKPPVTDRALIRIFKRRDTSNMMPSLQG